MIVSVEISYYPLSSDYNAPVDELIALLKASNLTIESGKMSTLITGKYFEVFKLLETSLYLLFEKHPSVFTLKISNCCPI